MHTHTPTVNFFFYFSESQLDFILERDLTLTFDNTSRRQCFDVGIVVDQDDNEPEEFFSLVLSLTQFFPGLSINSTRDTAFIIILPSTPPTRKSNPNYNIILDCSLAKIACFCQ